jgi:hypothetical protein
MRLACSFRRLAETLFSPKGLMLRETRSRTGGTPALPKEKKMPEGDCVRHPAFVDVQQLLNCALPSHFFEPRFAFAIPGSSRHVRLDDQLIHPKDLAVDLFNHSLGASSLR